MPDLIEYKCPCCAGTIVFDSGSQKMKCPSCGTEFDIETLKSLQHEKNSNEAAASELDWGKHEGEQWSAEEAGAMRVYVCQACGGEVVADQTTAATTCPFCGNAVVMKGQVYGDLKPEGIIPFKLDKKAAKEGLQEHLKGKKLLPKVFTSQNHIDEIKGVYVPFWVYDAEVAADITYNATKIRRWSDNDNDYKETSHYFVRRSGTIGFNNVPVECSTKADDALMESIEPFDSSQEVPFDTAYLSGYMADRYDIESEKCVERANQRIEESTKREFEEDVIGYDSKNVQEAKINLNHPKSRYVLYPVWLLNTTWKDKQYTFAMNGQTGKFVGDLPVDRGAFWRRWLITLLITAAAVFGIAAAVQKFNMNWGMWGVIAGVVGIIVAFIVVAIMRAGLKSVQHKDTAFDYERENSLHIVVRTDLYLYNTVDRTPKSK